MMKQIILALFLLNAINTFSQTGQYVKDSRKGCLIYSEAYSPKETVTWSGTCKNGYASGKGELIWFKDNTKTSSYIGQMEKGKPNGIGTLNWLENNKVVATHTGQMKNGSPNGEGKLVMPGYATFIGNFKNGALNGKGAVYFNNGGKTIGNFVNGTFLNLDDKYLPLLKKQYLPIEDTTNIYENDDDSKKLFYYALVPKNTKAVLVLFPSTGETVENVISCNKALMQSAYDNGILTAVISANLNETLETDPIALSFFEAVFKELVAKFNAPKNKFILAGLSLGGENVLQYTEMSRNQNYNTFLKPLAVIGLDPPVDMADLYNRAKKQIVTYEKEGAKLSDSKKIALKENYFLVDVLTKRYGGLPEQYPDRYMEGSTFSKNLDDGGNAKYLINVPVRLYCDPDIVWQLKNKGRDLYNMNATNLSAMINFLMQNGNTKAEFISALGKGFRVDGTRHPHSWSIVEPKDCIKWMLGLVK